MGSYSDRTPSLTIWQDFHRLKTPTVNQLDNIKAHLDLVILALEAIANITSDSILNAAKELDLESVISDRVALWRLRQSNPLRNSSGGRKKARCRRSAIFSFDNLLSSQTGTRITASCC